MVKAPTPPIQMVKPIVQRRAARVFQNTSFSKRATLNELTSASWSTIAATQTIRKPTLLESTITRSNYNLGKKLDCRFKLRPTLYSLRRIPRALTWRSFAA